MKETTAKDDAVRMLQNTFNPNGSKRTVPDSLAFAERPVRIMKHWAKLAPVGCGTGSASSSVTPHFFRWVWQGVYFHPATPNDVAD